MDSQDEQDVSASGANLVLALAKNAKFAPSTQPPAPSTLNREPSNETSMFLLEDVASLDNDNDHDQD